MKKDRSTYRPKIPARIRRQLIYEAGKKCANPGCSNRLVEIHHIRQWHVYQMHNAGDMIAICPTCHAHAHAGELKIDDATIRRWKGIRGQPTNTGYLHIERGLAPRVLMGCIYWRRMDGNGAVVFRLSDRNSLSFRIIPGNVMEPGCILNVSLVLSDPSGEPIVEVTENHLTHAIRDGVEFEQRPGRLRITVPATDAFVSGIALDAFAASGPPSILVENQRLTLIDIEVLDTALVQVEGIWIEGDRAVISSKDWLSLRLPEKGFTHWRGYGKARGDKILSNLPELSFSGALDVSLMSKLLNSGKLPSAGQF